MDAVRRTSGREALAAIDRTLEVAEDGSMTWEVTVDRLAECGWRATAA